MGDQNPTRMGGAHGRLEALQKECPREVHRSRPAEHVDSTNADPFASVSKDL
jgi:hypothetical protein